MSPGLASAGPDSADDVDKGRTTEIRVGMDTAIMMVETRRTAADSASAALYFVARTTALDGITRAARLCRSVVNARTTALRLPRLIPGRRSRTRRGPPMIGVDGHRSRIVAAAPCGMTRAAPTLSSSELVTMVAGIVHRRVPPARPVAACRRVSWASQRTDRTRPRRPPVQRCKTGLAPELAFRA